MPEDSKKVVRIVETVITLNATAMHKALMAYIRQHADEFCDPKDGELLTLTAEGVAVIGDEFEGVAVTIRQRIKPLKANVFADVEVQRTNPQ